VNVQLNWVPEGTSAGQLFVIAIPVVCCCAETAPGSIAIAQRTAIAVPVHRRMDLGFITRARSVPMVIRRFEKRFGLAIGGPLLSASVLFPVSVFH
jgi:hypothetical protein